MGWSAAITRAITDADLLLLASVTGAPTGQVTDAADRYLLPDEPWFERPSF